MLGRLAGVVGGVSVRTLARISHQCNQTVQKEPVNLSELSPEKIREPMKKIITAHGGRPFDPVSPDGNWEYCFGQVSDESPPPKKTVCPWEVAERDLEMSSADKVKSLPYILHANMFPGDFNRGAVTTTIPMSEISAEQTSGGKSVVNPKEEDSTSANKLNSRNRNILHPVMTEVQKEEARKSAAIKEWIKHRTEQRIAARDASKDEGSVCLIL